MSIFQTCNVRSVRRTQFTYMFKHTAQSSLEIIKLYANMFPVAVYMNYYRFLPHTSTNNIRSVLIINLK